ncbi:MAG: flavin reductase family protein [Pseudomonadales bacterium]
MCRTIKRTQDSRALRDTLGQFPTGVAVVTALAANGRPVGMTINSFNSISMTPPLVAWCVDRRAISYQTFARTRQFTISLLAEEQLELAQRFAIRGEDKFHGIPVERNTAPIIPDSCAWFQCTTDRQILLGDHLMLVGQVTDFERYPKRPLVFAQGTFQQLPHIATQAA